MLGRPKLGTHRMVTVATRVEPDELQRLRQLAGECSMSVCGYVRELVRLELSRAGRDENLYHGPVNGNLKPIGSDGRQARRDLNRYGQ